MTTQGVENQVAINRFYQVAIATNVSIHRKLFSLNEISISNLDTFIGFVKKFRDLDFWMANRKRGRHADIAEQVRSKIQR